jgi:EAL domain-containing protein (putative c-di-GMP-specific phosphodiesterase class I)
MSHTGMSSIPDLREVERRAAVILEAQGGLGVIVIDLLSLARIERSFGGSAYAALRNQLDPLLAEVRGRVREDDILARDAREGDRYIIFLSGRRTDLPFAVADLDSLCARIAEFLTPRVARLTLPYLREKPTVDVGYGFVLHSALESEERQVLRAIDQAVTSADLRRRLNERALRESVVEIIYNRSVWTAFQPIVEIDSRKVMGHEGLSRGPRGSEFELPLVLFGFAGRYGLTEELERACRRQAFVDWEVFGAPGRLFVNTVPATVRDTSFLGRGLLDFLGPRLSPRFVTLEITERQVIENVNLYREAMHAFLDLGFTFAIDDVGSGYSGLETVANLGASYLKIDMGLVRDVHQKRVSQQVVKAILDLGNGTGATVIAEGIQSEDEAKALLDLGIRYGQGYLFGRPKDPYLKPPMTVKGTG